jgi:hypothetical protein
MSCAKCDKTLYIGEEFEQHLSAFFRAGSRDFESPSGCTLRTVAAGYKIV